MSLSHKITKHHIIPRSRGGKNLESNICYVPSREHNLYHQLFENKTPIEITDYLNKSFWGGNYEIHIQTRRYSPIQKI